MQNKIDIAEFWNQHGLDFIIPKNSKTEFPEGFDVLTTLNEWVGDSVTEVGCGYGRLSPAFNDYKGYDINDAALKIAKGRYPNHSFEKMPDIVEAETVLLFTVLLHIPDSDIDEFIGRIKCKRLLIAEIMDRKWRRPFNHGEVPAFNRFPEEYKRFGSVIRQQDFPYEYYPEVSMTWLMLER